jgi:hypothetical protein
MTEPSIEEIVVLLEGMIASNRNPTSWEAKVGEFSRALIVSWRKRGEALKMCRPWVVPIYDRDNSVERLEALRRIDAALKDKP